MKEIWGNLKLKKKINSRIFTICIFSMATFPAAMTVLSLIALLLVSQIRQTAVA